MRVLKPGHRYELNCLDGPTYEFLQFVQRRPHHEPRPGTTNQEVCRALIDRIKVLDQEVPWEGNVIILRNLRNIIFLHEVRAYQRHAEKEGHRMTFDQARGRVMRWLEVNHADSANEHVPVGSDGHWRAFKEYPPIAN